jgi:hypothetical protein
MRGKDNIVKQTLSDPEEIRESKTDPLVYLFYKNFDRRYCVVVKIENGSGFLITAYPVDAIKEGTMVWKK